MSPPRETSQSPGPIIRSSPTGNLNPSVSQMQHLGILLCSPEQTTDGCQTSLQLGSIDCSTSTSGCTWPQDVLPLDRTTQAMTGWHGSAVMTQLSDDRAGQAAAEWNCDQRLGNRLNKAHVPHVLGTIKPPNASLPKLRTKTALLKAVLHLMTTQGMTRTQAVRFLHQNRLALQDFQDWPMAPSHPITSSHMPDATQPQSGSPVWQQTPLSCASLLPKGPSDSLANRINAMPINLPSNQAVSCKPATTPWLNQNGSSSTPVSGLEPSQNDAALHRMWPESQNISLPCNLNGAAVQCSQPPGLVSIDGHSVTGESLPRVIDINRDEYGRSDLEDKLRWHQQQQEQRHQMMQAQGPNLRRSMQATSLLLNLTNPVATSAVSSR